MTDEPRPLAGPYTIDAGVVVRDDERRGGGIVSSVRPAARFPMATGDGKPVVHPADEFGCEGYVSGQATAPDTAKPAVDTSVSNPKPCISDGEPCTVDID